MNIKLPRALTLSTLDFAAFALALAASYPVARYISVDIFGWPPVISGATSTHFIILYSILAVAGVIYFSNKGHYTWRTPWWQQVEQILVFCLVALIIDGFVNYALKAQITRAWVVMAWVFVVPSIMLARWLGRWLLCKAKHWEIPTSIIGDAEGIVDTLFTLRSESYLTYDIQNVVLFNYSQEQADLIKEVFPEVSLAKKLPAITYRHFAILAPDNMSDKLLQPTIEAITKTKARYAVVPPVRGLSLYGMSSQQFFGQNTVLLEPHISLHSKTAKFIKRLFDIIVSITLLLAIAPIILGIYIAIACGGGKVFYRQKRLGIDGSIFACWKFRSMVLNAEELLEEAINATPETKKHWDKFQKLQNDPRVTKVGKFLRKTSLDELPQLFNVITGDMSLVGPRPLIPNEQEKYGTNIKNYILVKPGITGLWQVSGRNHASFAQRASMDKWYIKNWSLWNDVVILIKTVFVVFGKTGAY